MRFSSWLIAWLLGGAAYAQCEIARPDSGPQGFLIGSSTFTGDLVALAGNGNQVLIYEPVANAWTNTVTLTVPGLVLFENPVVVTDGQRVLVGMVEDGDTLNAEGRVYVYEPDQSWQAPVQLSAASGTGLDTFGSGMALAGNVAVIGASMTVQDVLCGPGKCLIFEHDGTSWVEVAEFHPHGQNNNMGGYGLEMDTDGVTAVLGADMDDELLSFAGAAYIYERGPAGWSELIKLTTATPMAQERFGASVAVEGATLVVGAPGSEFGSVYIYERLPSGWSQKQVLTASNGRAGDFFGAAVSLDGGRLVVGATGIDTHATQGVGGIYTFERTAGVWSEVSRVVALDATTNQGFGTRVHLTGNQVLWSGSYLNTQTRLHSLGLARTTSICSIAQSAPNSAGTPATIQAVGCDSVIAGDFGLLLEGAPPGEPGAFLISSAFSQTPFGNGWLCLASPQVLSVGMIDASGSLSMDLDFLMAPADQVLAGSNWNFQAYFRDTNFGAGFGTSDGVAVYFNL